MQPEEQVFFPMILFMFAALKDFVIDPLCAALMLTGFGLPIGWVLGLFTSLLFGFSIITRNMTQIGGSWQKLKVKILVRYILGGLLVNLFPGINLFIPEAMFTVYLVHREEKKTHKKIMEENSLGESTI